MPSSDTPSSPCGPSYMSSSPPPLPPPSMPPVPQVSAGMSPVLIDTIARDFGLESKQAQVLHTFVAFGSLGSGLSLPDLATRVFMLAAQFSDAAERRRIQSRADQERVDSAAIFRDLKIRLEETFCFTRQQKAHIRGVVQDVIYEGHRTKFLTLHTDVWPAVEHRKVEFGLENIFGIPGREKSLGQFIKKQCSSVRNAWRTDLIASIDPKKFTPLSEFVFTSANKYRIGGGLGEIQQIYTIHAVLLRRFVFDNPSLKKATAAEEEELESDVDHDEAEERRVRKKPKLGRIARGANFWGGVDNWFKKQISERGSSLTGPKWKSYVDQLLKDDEAKLKSIAPGSLVVEERTPLASVGELQPLTPPTQEFAPETPGVSFQTTERMLEILQTGGSYTLTR
ncbi:hypothetical protein R3P38DRAFT_3212714 [Favolaschia claudopus]|uniref:Uncharacterized protein n=1 Tax=Favolaschia claudopus TaxID=2862362 RepID=A0AAW0ADF9_9AGAR